VTPPAEPARRPAAGPDAVLGVAPRLVFEPASEEEAAEAMRACARDRMRLAFVGGGTDLGLGNPPAGLDAVVRTARLSQVLEHSPHDQIVRVGAGITLSALQAHLAPHGQRLALDPPFPDRATAGGILCANAFGPLRASRGSARDLVIGISLVRADGVVARGGGKVVKNVAGFDLPRVLFGSLGTLGLVTAVNFRLHPLPEAAATVLFAGLSPAQVRQVSREVLAAQVEPAASAALARDGRLDLAVRFEGFGPGVSGQVDRLLEAARRAALGGERLSPDAAAALWARQAAARERGPFRARLAAPPRALEQAAAALATLLRALPGGDGVWYPSLGLGFAGGEPAAPEALASAASDARGALSALGGSLVVNDAPPEVRARLDAWGPPPATLPLMRRLKAQLDPEGRLAPGRFVGGI
jgi:glycolate oxidase FAD binding subunit